MLLKIGKMILWFMILVFIYMVTLSMLWYGYVSYWIYTLKYIFSFFLLILFSFFIYTAITNKQNDIIFLLQKRKLLVSFALIFLAILYIKIFLNSILYLKDLPYILTSRVQTYEWLCTNIEYIYWRWNSSRFTKNDDRLEITMNWSIWTGKLYIYKDPFIRNTNIYPCKDTPYKISYLPNSRTVLHIWFKDKDSLYSETSTFETYFID